MSWENLLISSFQRAPWGWGLLLASIIALVKVWPVLKKLAIGEHEKMRQEYIDQIKALRAEVSGLRDKVEILTAENADLRVQMAGMRGQHISEQAAAIRHAPAVKEAVVAVAKEVRDGKA